MHVRTEGGSGGKRGHSNMDHWSTTAEIKRMTRKARRRQDLVVTTASVYGTELDEEDLVSMHIVS